MSHGVHENVYTGYALYKRYLLWFLMYIVTQADKRIWYWFQDTGVQIRDARWSVYTKPGILQSRM